MTAPADTAPPAAEIDAEMSSDTVDPEAPFGRKLDGTPKRGRGGRPSSKSTRRPGAGSRPSPSGPSTATPSAPRPSTAKRKPAARGGQDYRPAITGFLAIPALILNWFSPLDGAAVLLAADDFAEAVNDTAKDRAEVAAMCDKLLHVGPYAAIVASLLKPVAQICENHGVIPTDVAVKMGAVPKAQLMADLKEAAEYAAGIPVPLA
jgi:hypothetical protein